MSMRCARSSVRFRHSVLTSGDLRRATEDAARHRCASARDRLDGRPVVAVVSRDQLVEGDVQAVDASLSAADGLCVARFVDHELPVPDRWPGGAEVREVEGEDRQLAALGECHDGGVGESEVEVAVAAVDLDSAAEDGGGEVGDFMLAAVECSEEEARCVRSYSGACELVDFDDHGFGHDEVATDLRDELGRERVCLVAPAQCCQQRPGVGYDFQRAVTISWR